MPAFTDQLGREIKIKSQPQRIVSVVPSQTELLYYLGLDDKICGITKFCIHPADKVKNATKIGGTKQLNIELIKNLQPDLIIANKEENEQSQVEELMQHFPVWVSDINTLPKAIHMIISIGKITATENKANSLSSLINNGFGKLSPLDPPKRTVYFIWRKPYMVAGKGTFIDDMLSRCGFSNAIKDQRYPEISADELAAVNPEVVLLSSEPYPFKNKHIAEIKTILPGADVLLVDGEMFSWYGNRLLYAPEYFAGLTGRHTQINN